MRKRGNQKHTPDLPRQEAGQAITATLSRTIPEVQDLEAMFFSRQTLILIDSAIILERNGANSTAEKLYMYACTEPELRRARRGYTVGCIVGAQLALLLAVASSQTKLKSYKKSTSRSTRLRLVRLADMCAALTVTTTSTVF